MKKWNKAMADAWKRMKPPIRPSKYDLAVFRQFLKQKIKEKGRSIKVLILGSTPEFRDLINKEKLTAYVCDYSKENYEALKLLKKVKGKEVLVKQDWRKLHLKDKFDLVFAEASLNMVKKNEVPKILKNVKNILADDGQFIAKTWMRLPRNKVSLKKIINTYRRRFPGKNFYLYSNTYLISYWYDKKREAASLREKYFQMKRLYEKGIITKKEFSYFEGHSYETTPLELYLPLEKEWPKILNKHLRLVKTIIPKQIGVNRVPIYVLRK